MSEETSAAEEAGSAPDTSGLAIDLAMEEARGNPALARHAAAFLEDQRGLIADQRHHMRVQLRGLHLGIAEKWLGVLLRVATAFTGLAVAAGLAYLIWNAAASNDLVIDSFQVPPGLAERGMSGQVVAAKLSDKIATMQAQTTSQRAPKSYANGISDGLKLDIPETGVSLAELDRFLRAKLGHDLHIGGEMVQAGNGVALTARVGADSTTVTGMEAEIDTLLQKLAEKVYQTTQPYRFSVWLQSQRRVPEGVAILKALATANGPAKERAWAYNGWAIATIQGQSEKMGTALLRRGHELDPDSYLLLQNLGVSKNRLGHEEESARDAQAALSAITVHGSDYTLPERIPPLVHNYTASILVHRGALLEAAEQQRLFLNATVGINAPSFALLAEILSGLHEPAAAAAALAQNAPPPNLANAGTFNFASLQARLVIAVEAQDWAGALAAEQGFTALTALYPGFAEDKPTMVDPSLALALAHLGRFAEAEVRLKPMHADCYPCLRAHAQVAALAGQSARADFWFAHATAAAPTSPYADTEWGRALLDRKQPDVAIEKFIAANKIGPHFADPLEGWGEALMAQNQSHLALAKFAAAEKYAPNWGRLQLKWGEALVYAGKKSEAAKHFARATTLDLTPSEKSELAKANPHG
jgi:tetratricopeptide (TPR) repeat protein